MLAGKRITLLSKEEIEYFYDIPELTNNDRMALFDLSETDHKEINKLPTEAVKIDYILQFGYFRATNFLFNFTFHQVDQDVWFITQLSGMKVEIQFNDPKGYFQFFFINWKSYRTKTQPCFHWV